MKKAASILNIVFCAFECLYLVIMGVVFFLPGTLAAMIGGSQMDPYALSVLYSTSIALGVFFLVLIVVDILLVIYIDRKLKTATKKDQLIVPAVICIIFVNLIVGILMLLIQDDELNSNATSTPKNEESID